MKRERIRNPKDNLKLKASAISAGKSEIKMMGRYLSPMTEYKKINTKANKIPNTKRFKF
jgi:hypothetical protein